MVSSILPKAIKREEVIHTTLQELHKWITGGIKSNAPPSITEYARFANKISCTQDGILLRDQRIIVPVKLRPRIIELAHAGHQGIVKTKALIKSRVWFPGIDNQVEQVVTTCRVCQALTTKETYEPLLRSKMSSGP